MERSRQPTASASPWRELRAHLDGLDEAVTTPPPTGRVGAALVLLGDSGDGDLEVVYTRRRDDLPTHPGQISFPGGRVEAGETIETAAVREAVEEVAVDPATVEVLGRLPMFYIPPSRFWLAPVVARWHDPHDLVPAESEVAEVLRVRVSLLRDTAAWRAVRLSASGWSWAWQLDPRHLLWGATAMVTTTLLEVLDPRWHGGRDPVALGADREVRPWDTGGGDLRHRQVPSPGPARLAGLPEITLDAISAAPAEGFPSPAALGAAAAGAAVATRRLLDDVATGRPTRRIDPHRGVVVLAGAGGNGAAGIATAALLAREGVRVRVVTTVPPDRLPDVIRDRVAGLDVQTFDGSLPLPAVLVDALVGGGLQGALRGTARAALLASHAHRCAVVSLDVPSGLDPVTGLVGDTAAADVTVAFGRPRPGLLHPGLGPFVGDLHLIGSGDSPLLRVVPPTATATWRE